MVSAPLLALDNMMPGGTLSGPFPVVPPPAVPVAVAPSGLPEVGDFRPGDLTESLRELLTERLELAPLLVGRLKLLARPGHLAGRDVIYLKVIDPDQIDAATLDTLDFDNFKRSTLPERALYCEGRAEPDGKMVLVPAPWLGFSLIKPVVGGAYRDGGN
jgi:hypothetical protein